MIKLDGIRKLDYLSMQYMLSCILKRHIINRIKSQKNAFYNTMYSH